jgi:hypothetical protein
MPILALARFGHRQEKRASLFIEWLPKLLLASMSKV